MFTLLGKNKAGEWLYTIDDLAVDPRNGDIYLVGKTPTETKVLRFDREGNFLSSFSDKDLLDPQELVVDQDGAVYIFDAGKKEVLIFSPGTRP